MLYVLYILKTLIIVILIRISYKKDCLKMNDSIKEFKKELSRLYLNKG